MKSKSLLISLSATLLISGCASYNKTERIGENNGSDRCFVFLDRLDDIAIYYKDQRVKDIAVGAAVGALTGVAAATLAHGGDGAAIIGGVSGAIVGGVLADAYWKNTMKKANNQLTLASNFIETDVKFDIDKLTSADRDIANLVHCRIEHRDFIKKQYAEGKLTTQQAQLEWKNWGDSVRKDREEMKYLDDALANIKKIEESYTYAATAIEDPSLINEETQKKWQQELNIDHEKTLAEAEQNYKQQVDKKGLTKSKKVQLKTEHKNKISEINKLYASKEANIKNTVNPTQSQLKLLVASVHEKNESVKKNKETFDNLAIEAGNSKGFEQINGKLATQNNYAMLTMPSFP